MSNTDEELFSFQVSSKVLNCPYKHRGCLNYDHFLKQGLCQPHTNRHHKSVRCPWLPSWIPDGWHFTVVREGRLSARQGLGGR